MCPLHTHAAGPPYLKVVSPPTLWPSSVPSSYIQLLCSHTLLVLVLLALLVLLARLIRLLLPPMLVGVRLLLLSRASGRRAPRTRGLSPPRWQ